MIDQIKECQKCGLCLNQRPLLDSERECEVFWVGLSAKKVNSSQEIPLSPDTNTGMLIEKIEKLCKETSTYKTNLVKCLPLNDQQKLRYPNMKEMDTCFDNLSMEMKQLSPKIVFLLGKKVALAIEKHLNLKFKKWDEFDYGYEEYEGTYYVSVHHPSYIYVYKRKMMDLYIKSIENIISELT